jgi:hypothetical protein
MIDWMLNDFLRNCQFLSDAMADMTRIQWRVFGAQSRFGLSMWNALLGVSPQGRPPGEKEGEVAEPGSASPAGNLEQVAAERLRSGLAPAQCYRRTSP